eukprot:scaffold276018_cov33-Prasinocladus_malaysianus.AAC.2
MNANTNAMVESPFPPAGVACKGQVYHFSHIVTHKQEGENCVDSIDSNVPEGVVSRLSMTREAISGAKPVREGFAPLEYHGRVLATYAHLYFPSAPEYAQALVESARLRRS